MLAHKNILRAAPPAAGPPHKECMLVAVRCLMDAKGYWLGCWLAAARADGSAVGSCLGCWLAAVWAALSGLPGRLLAGSLAPFWALGGMRR